VFFYHSLESRLGDYPTWDAITRVGGLGILPFFVISGVAITLTLPRSTPANFVRHRIKRLLPALLFVSILQSFLTMWTVRNKDLTADDIEILFRDFLQGLVPLPNSDGTFTNFVTWTIAIEVRFYALALLFLVILKVMKRAVSSDMIMIGLSVWVGLLYLDAYSTIPIINTLIIPIEGPYFALGVLFGLTVNRQISRNRIFLLAIFIVPLIANHLYTQFNLLAPVNSFSNVVFIVLSVILVLIFLHVPNPPGKAINAFLPEIGRASYPLYLIGGAFGMMLVRLPSVSALGTPISQLVVYVFISLAAILFSKYVEPRFFPKLFIDSQIISKSK